jgi:ornithine--oxo-acid transaminase
VLEEENLSENSERLGKILLKELKTIQTQNPQLVKQVRGKGLFCAMIINDSQNKNAWDICVELMKNGLLAKPTHGDIIRFAPPLIITKTQLMECVSIIKKVISESAK